MSVGSGSGVLAGTCNRHLGLRYNAALSTACSARLFLTARDGGECGPRPLRRMYADSVRRVDRTATHAERPEGRNSACARSRPVRRTVERAPRDCPRNSASLSLASAGSGFGLSTNGWLLPAISNEFSPSRVDPSTSIYSLCLSCCLFEASVTNHE